MHRSLRSKRVPPRGHCHQGERTRGLLQHPLCRVTPGPALLLFTLWSSSLAGNREEEWQWGDWGVPSWGFQRWTVWSGCYFRETRGPENTSSPLCEPGGATVENWERARGRGKNSAWNSLVGRSEWSKGWRCQAGRRRERNKIGYSKDVCLPNSNS